MSNQTVGMVGIDVSKESLDYALVEPRSMKALRQGHVSNDEAGVLKLLAQFEPDLPLVVEPTGRYSDMVVRLGKEAGRTVLLAETRQASLFARSLNNGREKSDAADARGLSLLGASRALPEYHTKSESADEIEQLEIVRRNLTQTLTRFKQQRQDLPRATQPLDQIIEDLERRLKELDKRLMERTKADPAYASLTELMKAPGIGPVSAIALTVRLVDRQFASADKFVAYIGLDVQVRQSGKYLGQRRLNKHGDSELRRLLYCCAQSSLRCKDTVFKEEYARQLDNGRSSTEALCVVARKMARLCWAVVHYHRRYDPSRVLRRTTTKPGVAAQDAPPVAVQ